MHRYRIYVGTRPNILLEAVDMDDALEVWLASSDYDDLEEAAENLGVQPEQITAVYVGQVY